MRFLLLLAIASVAPIFAQPVVKQPCRSGVTANCTPQTDSNGNLPIGTTCPAGTPTGSICQNGRVLTGYSYTPSALLGGCPAFPNQALYSTDLTQAPRDNPSTLQFLGGKSYPITTLRFTANILSASNIWPATHRIGSNALYYGNAAAPAQQNITGTWPANHIAVYHMGTASTALTGDSTANANSLTNNAAVTQGTGEIGNSAVFAGTNYLSTTANLTALGGSIVSVSMWANSTSLSHDNYWTSKCAINTCWSTFQLSDNNLYVRGGGVSGTSISAATAGFTAGTLHYITSVANGTVGKLYVDGVLVKSGTVNTLIDTAAHLGIGGDSAGSGKMIGSLDEVRIRNDEPLAGQVATNFANQSNPTGFRTVGAQEHQ